MATWLYSHSAHAYTYAYTQHLYLRINMYVHIHVAIPGPNPFRFMSALHVALPYVKWEFSKYVHTDWTIIYLIVW